MSDPSATDESSDSGSEDWATAYDSEFDLTLSNVDDDLLEAMRNFNVDDPHPIRASMLLAIRSYDRSDS